MIEMKKIDAHGHFGRSYLGPESPIGPYVEHARQLGVVCTIASPGPAPEIIREDKIVCPCLWKVENGQVSYISQETDRNSRVVESEADFNPYHEVNVQLLDAAHEFNQIGKTPQIRVMPIHHPLLDTESEVVDMVTDPRTVALKVHGIATFTEPRDISQSTRDHLIRFNKPLVVHTDMYRGEITSGIHAAYQLNDPSSWAEWGKGEGVKTLITHGARLSPKAMEIVKSSPNLMVGLSPDLLLMEEPERLHHETDDFLAELLNTLPPSKILFDIDYGWNVSERNRWDTQDWKMCERINSAAKTAGLTQQDLEAIYFQNAVNFYNI